MTPAARLRCAESHVAAIRTMVEAGAPCTAVLLQIRAVRGSLRAVARFLMEAEIRTSMREEGVSATARLTGELKETLLKGGRRG